MQTLFSGINQAVNAYLRLDHDTFEKFKAFNRATIAITITDWSFTFFMTLSAHGMHCSTESYEPPEAHISASSWQFLKAMRHAHRSKAALFGQRIQITGNTQLVENLFRLLSQIDIDWEEQLSTITGDMMAHKIGVQARRARHGYRRTLSLLQHNLKEYLQLESQLLVTREDLKKFSLAVTRLRQDLERTEVYMNQLDPQASA